MSTLAVRRMWATITFITFVAFVFLLVAAIICVTPKQSGGPPHWTAACIVLFTAILCGLISTLGAFTYEALRRRA